MYRPPTNKRGFTLVEIMVIVGILGLMAAIAVPSFNGYLRANRIDVTADQIASDIALARSIAVSEGRVMRFIGEADGYVISDPGSGRIIRDREFAGAVRLQADVTVNLFPWGAADAATLNLDNGNQVRQIQILPTGMVEVGP